MFLLLGALSLDVLNNALEFQIEFVDCVLRGLIRNLSDLAQCLIEIVVADAGLQSSDRLLTLLRFALQLLLKLAVLRSHASGLGRLSLPF